MIALKSGAAAHVMETRALPSCPICFRLDCPAFALAYDRLFGWVKGEFRLHRCLHCGTVFQSPLPKQDLLQTFYLHGYWWETAPDSSGKLMRLIGYLEQAYRNFVTADQVRFLIRCAARDKNRHRAFDILDIGCGTGTFLYLARRRGFITHGQDVSTDAVAIARKQYDLDVREGKIGSETWEGRQFDIVTMFHVLEHLPDPRGALKYAEGLLKPGGSLIVQVPNVDSLQARIFGVRWHGLDVPRHLINFTPAAMSLLLRESGFEICSISHFSLRDNPAAIASSLAPRLDPVGRRGRDQRSKAGRRILVEFSYLGLTVFALPLALFESMMARGGTIMVHAKRLQ